MTMSGTGLHTSKPKCKSTKKYCNNTFSTQKNIAFPHGKTPRAIPTIKEGSPRYK